MTTPIIRLTKTFSLDFAHALDKYEGSCRNIHGHTYHLSVTIIGAPEEKDHSPVKGMVTDFGNLKAIVKQAVIEPHDHALVLYEYSDFVFWAKKLPGQKLVLKPYNPTCEMLTADFASLIESRLPRGIALHHVKLYETDTSFAEWYAEDNRNPLKAGAIGQQSQEPTDAGLLLG